MDDSTPVAPPMPGPVTPQTKERIKSHLVAANFGNMVTVLMQSPGYENAPISDLRTFVVPPLTKNQFRIAEALVKDSGHSVPVAMLLWAKVSEEVDKRMTDATELPIRLDPADWDSGDIFWVVDAIGQQRFLEPLLKDLMAKEFKGRTVKYRRKTDTGTEIATMAA
ncbi:MAG: toxin-activating lysine-acyltransferase [Hyphomicrobiaceae bacterium]